MKHAREDYQHIQDSTGKIPMDEPVFLLRAQDVTAPATLRYWANLNRQNGGDPQLIQAAEAQADQMERWPVRKMPDLMPRKDQPGMRIQEHPGVVPGETLMNQQPPPPAGKQPASSSPRAEEPPTPQPSKPLGPPNTPHTTVTPAG